MRLKNKKLLEENERLRTEIKRLEAEWRELTILGPMRRLHDIAVQLNS